jgi:signal transduction histidine kinase
VHGVLRVRTIGRQARSFDEDLLLSLGVACADVIHRASLHRELAETEHRLAIAQERERIARDLHDNVGQLVTALGMQLKTHAAAAPDEAWRGRFEELADQAAQGSRQIKEAIHSLLFLQVRRTGLVASLRDLVQTFEATSGVATDFEVLGRPGNVPTPKEDVLFRVAHEAFTNIRRHAGAAWAEVTLSYEADEVALAVRDHGQGFAPDDDPFRTRPGHFGLPALRQRLEEVGGALIVANAHPHGVLIEARIPLRRRRAEPALSARRVRTAE